MEITKPIRTPRSQNFRALFTTAVWGADYVDRFLNYSLRTQLSGGNLGAFDSNSLFLLITDKQSIKYITSSPIYQALTDQIQTECFDIDNIKSIAKNKYSLLTACQNYALSRAHEFDAIFFGYGDALWADGSYCAAAQRLAEGYDAVFSFGYPVLDLPFKAMVNKLAAEPPAIAIQPRDFAQQVYRHLHPMARANRWDSEWMSHCPSYITWDVPEQGLLLRAFHLHPVALRVQKDSPDFFAPFYSTLDEEFVARLNRTTPRIYVCESSDELGVCSLAEETESTYKMMPPRPVNIGDLTTFAEAHAGLLHRNLFNHSIRLVIDDVVESRWQTGESEAARISADVGHQLLIPDSVLALEIPAAFAARLRRQIDYQHWFNSEDISIGVDRSLLATSPSPVLNPNGTVTPNTSIARAGAVAQIVATNSTAANFVNSAVAAGGWRRRSWLRAMAALVRKLHAFGFTRRVRLVILPILPKALQTRLLRAVYNLGALDAMSASTYNSSHRRQRSRIARWLRKTFKWG